MKKCFVVTILLIVTSIYFTNTHYSNVNKQELFTKIVQNTSSKINRCGVKVTFKTSKNGENLCDDISEKISTECGNYFQAYKDGAVYCIDYKAKDLDGYIESVSYDNYNTITVNIEKITDKNEISKIESNILNSIEKNEKDIKVYSYIQASLPNDNLLKPNNDISEILKQNGACNIVTTKIDNGISTIAYTGSDEAVYCNGKLEDFNYAVSKYSSGATLTIGTPVIVASY